MATPIITSELDAINLMLSTIGEAPVASIDVSISEVEMAQNKLNHVILEVLARGRQFNREVNFLLTPNENGELVLPANALWVDVAKSEDNSFVHRGTRIYDRVNHTYKISKSVLVDMHIALAFEELPFAARLYVAVKAARMFQADVQGSEAIFRFSKKTEDDAEMAFEALDAEAEDANVLNSSYTTFNILSRYRGYGSN